jgi:histidinol-phosphate aminotransferase
MGLLDYYRRYADIDAESVNRQLRERRARERAKELARIPVVDLASTEWPEFPNAEVANAAIAVARGRLNGYPDPTARAVRERLAERHGVAPEQIVVGNGAAELIQTTAYLLLVAGDELLTPWPSYPLFPALASRVGARPVAVEVSDGVPDPAALREACSERTRVLVLANPNDPTGGYLPADALDELLGALPEPVHVLLDEAYVDFQDVEAQDACLALVERHPRLIAFRTFSKVWGLSGLRGGYAVGAPEASSLLEAIAPAHGVNALTQAGLAYAVERGTAEVARRRAAVIEGRRRVLAAVPELGLEATPTQANFAWMSAPGVAGADLAARLERSGVLVAAGGPLGDERCVRASIRGAAATERLLSALGQAVALE